MVATQGRGWRLAPCLVTMVNEADRLAPNRSRVSDGTIGDAAHSARKSDHNIEGGEVDALDLTHDPTGGWDAHARIRQVCARGDRRIKYAISQGRIWDPVHGWHRYVGPNRHDRHAHASVADRYDDDTSPWWTDTDPAPPPAPRDDTSPRGEDRFMIMRRHHDGTIWLYDGGGLVRSHVPTQGHADALGQLGVPFDDVSGNRIYSQVLLDVTRDIDQV